jgi:PhoH-like ATPase
VDAHRGTHRQIRSDEQGAGTAERRQMVLDTSVLIADSDAFDAFGDDVDVVLPLTVVEELDGLKSRPDEVGWLARAALRRLEAARVAAGGRLDGATLLDSGATLRVEVNGIHKASLAEHGLSADRADNRILGAALGLSQHSPVTVVSNDAALRIKAAHLGLDAAEHYAVTGDLGSGWETVEVSEAGVVDTLYQDKAVADTAAPGAPNTFAVLRDGSASALVRRRHGELQLLTRTYEAWGLRPRSKEQRFALELLMDPDLPVVALHGPAGTGKSILAIAAGLEQVVEQRRYHRLSVFRPLVPVGREEVGFLPGDLASKTLPYFAATFDAVCALTDRRSTADAQVLVDQLLASGKLTMEPVSFLRGRSLANTFIVVDEATNLERAVLKTLLTRVADGTKIVFTGDTSQIDNPFASASNNSLTALVASFSGQECFGHLRLTACERSQVASLAADLL